MRRGSRRDATPQAAGSGEVMANHLAVLAPCQAGATRYEMRWRRQPNFLIDLPRDTVRPWI